MMSETIGDLTLETMYEIWHDKTGRHIQVGCDRDSLDLVEIRDIDAHGKIGTRLLLSKEEAWLVVAALQRLLK